MEQEREFDAYKARAAQIEYCEKHQLPHFAPRSGNCYRCGRNIYTPREVNGFIHGIDVETAGSKHITGCPHCYRSYCD